MAFAYCHITSQSLIIKLIFLLQWWLLADTSLNLIETSSIKRRSQKVDPHVLLVSRQTSAIYFVEEKGHYEGCS